MRDIHFFYSGRISPAVKAVCGCLLFLGLRADAAILDPRYSNTAAQVSAYVTNVMAAAGVPGLSIALVDSNQVVWAQGFGHADIENDLAADENTIYGICSISKTFAGAAGLRAQELGMLALDNPVTNFVPSFSLLPRFGGARAITVRDLLDHNSGLPGTYFNHAFMVSPYTNYHAFVLDGLAKDYPIFPPGFANPYNNNGFAVFEEIIAAAAGTNYTQFVAVNFFAPMGMTSSAYYGAAPGAESRWAQSYMGGERYPREILNVPAGGGVYSSVMDMSRYVMMLLNWGENPLGGTVLQSNSVAALWADETTNLSIRLTEKFFRPGLGWDCIADAEFDYAGTARWKNGGSMTFGGWLEVIPERGLGVIVLNNYVEDLVARPVGREALRRALREKFGLDWPTNRFVPPASPITNLPVAELDAVTGCYAVTVGYDLIRRSGTSLTWVVSAHTDASSEVTNLVARENGWFSRPNSQDLELGFTNTAGRQVMYLRLVTGTYTTYQETAAHGERVVPVALSAAWTGRFGRTYFVSDLDPASYCWLPAFDISLRLAERQGSIFLNAGVVAPALLVPESDAVAFPRGVASAEPMALQAFTTNGIEYLRYSGFTYRPADSFPTLNPGTATNLTLVPGETAWWAVPGQAGDPQGLTISNAVAGLVFSVRNPDGTWLANGTNALQWICPSNGTYYLGVTAAGSTPADLRVYSLTNTIAQATQWIEEQMTNSGVVGLSVALVDGQEIAWAQGFGFADRENGIPVTTATVFRIGSVSKVFTTTAALQYRDQGKLVLDDSVTNYLPGLRLLDRGGFPGTEAIAVRDLLDHHSGLPGNLFNSYFTTEPLGDRYAWHTNYLAGAYPIYPPRWAYSYCNTAFILMEGVIEAVDGSGTPFTSLVNSNVFEPLDMDASSFLKDKPDIINKLAKPYSGGELMPEEYVNAYGTGGMYSRPIDLANYIRMVLAGGIAPNGKRILNADSVAEMLTPQATNAPFDPFVRVKVGLGWDSVKWPALSYAGDVAWKNGQTLAYSANLSVLPERNIGFVIMVNALADFAIATPDPILQHAVNDKYGMPAPTNMIYFPAATQAVSQAELDARAGVYAAAHGYHQVVANPGSLTLFASAVHSNMLLRTDGWFSAGDAPTNGMLITEIAGRTVLVWRTAGIGFAATNILGERFDPAPISAAWSNRLEKLWFALDDSPVSYLPYLGAIPCLTFVTNDGVLLVEGDYINGSCVLSPTNDDTAFICGLMNEADSAVQVFTSNTFEYLRFGGFIWRPADSFPVLYPGSMTNLSLAAGETVWFAVPGWTGDPQGLTITNASAPLLLNLYTPEGSLLGRGTNALPWICPIDGTYFLSVGSMGNATGDLRAYSLTNTIALATRWIGEQMTNWGVVGLSVALVDGQEIAWARGFGYADLENAIPVTTSTVFRIGSVSKAFTAAAALQYRDRGKLGLDDPVTNHLPGLRLLYRYPGTDSITLRDLLDHHSGLPGDLDNGAFTTEPIGARYAWLTNYLANTYPIYPPRQVNSYCNSGFTLMEGVIEAADGSGASFTTLVNSNLFEPLGMDATSFLKDKPEIIGQIAKPYVDKQVMPEEFINIYATGGMYSRPVDLAQYIRMILAGGVAPDGTRILETNSVAEMLTPQATNAPFNAPFDPRAGPAVGLGWDSVRWPALHYAGDLAAKGGATLVYHAYLAVLPDRDLGFSIALSSRADVDVDALVFVLQHAVSDKYGIPVPTNTVYFPSATQAVSQAELDALGGIYASGAGYQRVETNSGSLTLVLDAHSDEPTRVTNLLLRTDGWFSAPASPTVGILITNIAGRTALVWRQSYGAYAATNLWFGGERVHPAPLSAAWSNRLGKDWYVLDESPVTYHAVFGHSPRLTLTNRDGVLLVQKAYAEGFQVLAPTNDNLAFLCGMVNRDDSAVQAFTSNSVEYLRYRGFTYQTEDMFPTLNPGAATNLTLVPGVTAWLTIPVSSGMVCTLDITSTNLMDVAASNHINAYLFDADGGRIGKFGNAYSLTVTAPTNADFRIAVVSDAPNPLACRLGSYTNALPFYRAAVAAEHPDFMTNRWYDGSEFGYVFVPANRETNDLHTYRLPVVQLPSGPDATNGPLIYLSGGPGSSAINQVVLFAPFSNTCPVIIMNQRGTYLSQPDLFPHPANEPTADLQTRLGPPDGINFNTINTRENAADVHDVATALGYSTFNLWGTSYGTMLSQETLRQHPERIRSVVLDGVVTLDQPQWTTMGQAFYDAFRAFTNDVGRDADANRLYPGFGDGLLDFAGELYPDEYGDFFEGVFHQMNLSRWGRVEDVPALVWRAARGELAALAGLQALNVPIADPAPDGPMSANMYSIVLRHDMLPFESMTNAAALTNSIPFPLNMHGYAYSQDQFDGSEDWDFITPVDASFRTPVTNNVPVLVLNGRYDTQTPLRGARHVATNLPHAYYVELPYIGHVVLFGGDVPLQISRDFLVNPNVFPDTNGITGLSLTFSPPWGTNVAALAGNGIPQTNAWVTNNFGVVGVWYRFTAAEGERWTLDVGTAAPFALSIVDSNASVVTVSGDAATDWTCPESGEYYVWLLGSNPVTFTVAGSAPPLVSGMSVSDGRLVIRWQGETNTACAFSAANFLTPQDLFYPMFGISASPGRLVSVTNSPDPARAKFFRVEPTNFIGAALVISDVHFNPFVHTNVVTQLVATAYTGWRTLLEPYTNNAYFEQSEWGERNVNYKLFDSALNNAAAALPEPDFILYLGDFPVHNTRDHFIAYTGDASDAGWRSFAYKLLGFTGLEIARRYPGVPVFSVLGNNDTYLEDYQLDPEGTYLADAAGLIFTNGLSNACAFSAFAPDFRKGGYYSLPVSTAAQMIALCSAWLSSLYTNPSGFSAYDPATNELGFLDDELDACSAAGRSAWVLVHIPPGVDAYATFQGWGGAGELTNVTMMWKGPYLEKFIEIVTAHSNTVKQVFSGHTHEREFRLVSDPASSNAAASAHIAPGVDFSHGNNPAFQIVTYERADFDVKAELTYAISRSQHQGQTRPADWDIAASYNHSFGNTNFAAAAMDGVYTSVTNSVSERQAYWCMYETGSGRNMLTVTNWPVYSTAIRWLTATQFVEHFEP